MAKVNRIQKIVASEYRRCVRLPSYRLWAVFVIGFAVVGARFLVNQWAQPIYSFSETEWNKFRTLLANLAAVYYYVLPLFTAIVAHDLFDRSSQGLVATLSEHRAKASEIQWGRLLGRLGFLVFVVIVSFLAGLTVVIAMVLSEPSALIEIGRVIVVLIFAETLGVTIFWLVAAISCLVSDATKSIMVSMALLAFLLISATLISDMLLYRAFGPMPITGTVGWGDFLRNARDSAGTSVYRYYPMDTFLMFVTFLSGSVDFSAWFAIEVWFTPAIQAAIAFFIFLACAYKRRLFWSRWASAH